jgi:membrane protein
LSLCLRIAGAAAAKRCARPVNGFGAAGSLVIVLICVYYSAQIFLIGAEFTWVYANTRGSLRATATASRLRRGRGKARPRRRQEPG